MDRDIKQVIVMGNHLNMRKGKMVAQGAHASMGVFTKRGQMMEFEGKRYFAFEVNDREEEWLTGSFKKICLKAPSEAELQIMYDQAVKAGIPAVKIIDSGLTEFNGVPTFTSIAIGPDLPEKIDLITGRDTGMTSLL